MGKSKSKAPARTGHQIKGEGEREKREEAG
jgi:hypothetical protein